MLPFVFPKPFIIPTITSTFTPHNHSMFRGLSTAATTSSSSFSSSYSFKGDKIRVAIVGGGCAGLSCALHLAELVELGKIAGPIDVYDAGLTNSREIGVGIWSTGLNAFLSSNRQSHRFVYDTMTARGTWIGDVGYRIPDGTWLMKSHLPTDAEDPKSIHSFTADATATSLSPALLFLREKDLIGTLQTAVHLEEHRGTIRIHKNRVKGLYEESSQPWSTTLLVQPTTNNSPNENHTGTNDLSSCLTHTERDYHLIIATDGIHSTLRKRYGGHENVRQRLTGTSALPSPSIDVLQSPQPENMEFSNNFVETHHQEIVGYQDRHYTVFRGNAHMRNEQKVSFQTWGEGRNMRFATVPMQYPSMGAKCDDERQVWFITIEDDTIANEPDPVRRRDLLLEAFRDWHDPIRQTVLATPPEDILMERALAHRHCMGPVLNFNSNVVKNLHGRRQPSSGEGPAIVFVGDAMMTVDPILAQGFTMAMEGAALLRASIEKCCITSEQQMQQQQQQQQSPGTPPTTACGSTVGGGEKDPPLAFDPIRLRRELKARHVRRMDRLICLLRATELVQALGQPSGNTTGMFNTKILRPLTKLTPDFIKTPIFDAILRYSLGLGLFSKITARRKSGSTAATTSIERAKQ
jgi:2-polyprenyl-6-methoxyphenol hydroxylase-like FAD-dependent oxidoreductase